MGVYSLEAAELLAANNKPALNESFEPYENPVLEYGIRAIRADFALFEAQLELDFKEYYDTLNEADEKKDNNSTETKVFYHTDDPEFGIKQQEKQDEYNKKKEDKEKAEEASAAAAKKSRLNQAVGKLKIDSGTIAKFGEFIKNLWKNFIASIKSILNRLIGSFNKFADNNGEKFNAIVAKISNTDTISKYNGGDLNIIDPEKADAAISAVISKYESAFANVESMSKEDVDGKVNEINDDLAKVLQDAHASKVSASGAREIILHNAKILGTFKSKASTKFESLVKFGNSKETAANTKYSQAVRSSGQEAADNDVKLQVAKENAQKVSQLGAKLGAEYGKLMSSAVGSIYKVASAIVANSEGKDIKSKVKAAGEAIRNRGDNGETGEEDYDATGESFELNDDDLLTVNETAIALQAMVEDTCDINFDECFDF